GNAEPQSTTIISFLYSKAVMFLPISPTPPKNITLSVSKNPPKSLVNYFIKRHYILFGNFLQIQKKAIIFGYTIRLFIKKCLGLSVAPFFGLEDKAAACITRVYSVRAWLSRHDKKHSKKYCQI